MIGLSRDLCDHLESSLAREWLVTNGIGGFAAGSVSGANTRRYHGLLMAALNPPVGRTLLVAGADIAGRYLGREVSLSTNEYHGGFVHPAGYRYISAFRVEGGIPTWEFRIAEARISRRTWMSHGRNTTYVAITMDSGSAPLDLELRPLCTHRDYHAQARGRWPLQVRNLADGFEINAFPGAQPYRVLCAGAEIRPQESWYWNFRHRAEGERGLDDTEDLFCPGALAVRLAPGETITFVCTAEPEAPAAPAVALADERARQAALLAGVAADAPDWIRQLTLAADQFVVQRVSAVDTGGTVIAGYPWFSDWGRDTMIALPGLTLTTGRADIAERILRTFAGHVSDGMLPNRFPDGGGSPQYNTVDAALWYFQAVMACIRATDNATLACDLYPLLRDIVAWHQRGTRFGIHVDPADGLLCAGEPGVQLTWMDATVGDQVVTPRIGKPVEVNALWINALSVMADLATRLGDEAEARQYRSLQTAATAAFRERFWRTDAGCLFDVVDGPDGEPDAVGRRQDASVRPNQIFAVSLPAELLDARMAQGVVDTCARELLTPAGLRSLAPSDPRYVGRYEGDPRKRDGAYHQGTVWSWLIGPFALAHFRVYRNTELARSWLVPTADHLLEGCIGTVSEIFDGDAPHEPRGCFAQAWSVAEVLRAWHELGTNGR